MRYECQILINHAVSKLKNNSAQQVTQYSVLLIMVMVGIFIMGPYMIRSWNAQLKSWEYSVIDAYNEPFIEGDLLDLPECSSKEQYPCDNPPCCGFGTCSGYEATMVTTWSPVGCGEKAYTCTPDPSCCEKVPTGCGPNAPQVCDDGYMGYEKICGSDDPDDPDKTTTTYSCERATECDFECLGAVADNAQPCTTVYEDGVLIDPEDESGLPSDLYYEYVDECTPGRKCEYVCNANAIYLEEPEVCCVPHESVVYVSNHFISGRFAEDFCQSDTKKIEICLDAKFVFAGTGNQSHGATNGGTDHALIVNNPEISPSDKSIIKLDWTVEGVCGAGSINYFAITEENYGPKYEKQKETR